MSPITVSVEVRGSLDKVWTAFTSPEAVQHWNAASPDWHCPRAVNDLQTEGRFSYRMEARDGSAGFDFEGTYTEVVPQQKLAYVMDDGRKVSVSFTEIDGGVRVVEVFDPEQENPEELQRAGWQAILNAFKQYVENT